MPLTGALTSRDHDGLGDVGAGHRLDERRWQMHLVADRRGIRDRLDELEELRRMHDRVGDRAGADERLLGQLGVEVTALGGEPIGADHRQRDMVADARVGFGREQVGGRGVEELPCRIVEGRRVRDVDDYLRALDRLGQSLTGERVDAGRRGGGDGVVTVFGQAEPPPWTRCGRFHQ